MSAHPTHPLTRNALLRASVPPEFDYTPIRNARLLVSRLQPHIPFSASEIAAFGLIGKITQHLLQRYRRVIRPDLFQEADQYVAGELGPQSYYRLLRQFMTAYPSSPSQTAGDLDPSEKKFRLAYFPSLVLILLSHENPALSQDEVLFRFSELAESKAYQEFVSVLEKYFEGSPSLPSTSQSLLDLLRSPFRFSPDSLAGQLDYILTHWRAILPPALLDDLILSLDQLAEEHRFRGLGPGDAEGSDFSSAGSLPAEDPVQFSEDKNWMPRVVLLAKNVFVWLDQLSKKYQRPIYRLDQIPPEELIKLSSWGINCLWLIGLWERSPASQRIKQLTGNPDAIPSAYSLYDYVISESLGGDPAFQQLSSTARAAGIRLAADMVPNHVGIFSQWILDHPEWFISAAHPPFPGYTFQGPDLADHPDVEIYLEDGYYTKTDAAVVFKRVDPSSGAAQYIYHGNDGTAMPWNDTAQLNYLNPAVREAVIQTILHVARKFSVIRFDAAMTLTKRHYQRLWFPEPGSGGAIPTRAEYSLTQEEFNQRMPKEFWREVVDRIAREAPDTLLLAEAFWMMEGFFVRSLGMHRVYNSAFMHMLRDEQNAKYRNLIIKTLEFDPEILKRFVNFMNNPDEETALSQFGKGGKYFGVCTLMATLPGLPMFGHGQIEGFTEKYGMEYQRAYYNESPDEELIARHQKEIFPLLKKRYLFAGVQNFFLFDFFTTAQKLNQDVFAYANRFQDERALVLYHNAWAETQGWIRQSTNINQNQIDLADYLGIPPGGNGFLVYKDHITGLEYIRPFQELISQGLFFELGAYEYHVFWDFVSITENLDDYSKLHEVLDGEGVPDLSEKLTEIRFAPAASAIARSLHLLVPTWLHPPSSSAAIPEGPPGSEFSDFLTRFDQGIDQAVSSLGVVLERGPGLPRQDFSNSKGFLHKLAALPAMIEDWDVVDKIEIMIALFFYGLLLPFEDDLASAALQDLLRITLSDESKFSDDPDLQDLITRVDPHQVSAFVLILFHSGQPSIRSLLKDFKPVIMDWFSQSRTRELLQVHDHQSITWFNKEAFEDLAALFLAASVILSLNESALSAAEAQVAKFHKRHQEICSLLETSGFQVNQLLSQLQS